MKITRYAFVLGGLIFFLFFVSPAATYSQEIPPTSYLFAEVKDTTGKAVDGATVNVLGQGFKTNEVGVAESRFYSGLWGAAIPFELWVSKPGYLTSEHVVYAYSYRHTYKFYYFKEVFPDGMEDDVNDPKSSPLVLVLTRTPAAAAERRAVEVEEWKSRFLLAIKRGDAESVRALLQSGVSANTSDDKGVPAIAWAALAGNAETIRALLGAGADVRKNSLTRQALLIYLTDGLSKESNDPADKTMVERHEEIVRELVKAGADVNAQSPGRGTVLVSAISRTPTFAQPPYSLSDEAVRFLIAAGANVNSAGKDGLTPLMQAASLNSLEITKMLLGAGAKSSVNAKDKQEQTALMHAGGSRSADICHHLIKAGASVNEQDARGWTALMYAAPGYNNSALETVKVLTAAGANVNEINADGQTALMLAARWSGSDAEVIKTLLAAGADVNIVDKNGRTARSLAQEARNFSIVALLEAAEAKH